MGDWEDCVALCSFVIFIRILFCFSIQTVKLAIESGMTCKINVKASELKCCLAVVCLTIFAFLMLNTMSSAYEEIFGAKFLSFERAATIC